MTFYQLITNLYFLYIFNSPCIHLQPKTRHQRPYGWEKENNAPAFYLEQPPPSAFKFASLQHGARPPQPDGFAPPWLPPRQNVTGNLINKKSPSVETSPVFPFIGFTTEDKPYNEHPVTIYPGPNIQYNRPSHSPTFIVQKLSPSNSKNFDPKKINSKRDSRSDGEMLSPRHKLPPRTLAGSMERHREVCRGSPEDSEENFKATTSKSNDEDHFSDDSLEEAFPPPPPAVSTPSKRNSIAWEVSLDGDDPLLTPGSTKVDMLSFIQVTKKNIELLLVTYKNNSNFVLQTFGSQIPSFSFANK